MIDVAIASRTAAGGRAHNEDCLQHAKLNQGWFAVVSDGAGGHDKGDVAADLVVRVAFHELGSQLTRCEGRPPVLAEVAHAANDALNRLQQGAVGHARMHATVVMLWIHRADMRASWSHVGDSRLYHLRHGRVSTVTRDDSVVQQLIDAGLLDPGQARGHANRNRLLSALGAEEPISPNVNDAALELRDGDAFLLCTDGWYDTLEAADIERCMARAASADDWLEAMHATIASRSPPHQDNLSAVAVWVGDPGDVTQIGPLT